MKYIKFKVSEDCIGCQACIGVAEDNFEMNDQNVAFLIKQPDSEKEELKCKEAMDICPVHAIYSEKAISGNDIEPVLSTSNIKITLDKYPELKPVLIKLSPKFKRIQNPAMYNTLARFATFNDAAHITGLSVCAILHIINSYLGTEDKLLQSAPDCISPDKTKKQPEGENISWKESSKRYILNEDTLFELTRKISNLKPRENLVIISIDKPDILIKTVKGLGLSFNIEKGTICWQK